MRIEGIEERKNGRQKERKTERQEDKRAKRR